MLQVELVPRIHPFRRNAALTAVLLTCTLEIMIGLRVRLLPSHRIFCNDWLSPRQRSLLWKRPRAHSSGRVVFPFSCAEACRTACFGYCTSDGNLQFSSEKAKSCAFPSDTIHDIDAFCKRFQKNLRVICETHKKHPLSCGQGMSRAARGAWLSLWESCHRR